MSASFRQAKKMNEFRQPRKLATLNFDCSQRGQHVREGGGSKEGDILSFSSARWNLILSRLSGRPASSSSALLCVAMSSDQCQGPQQDKMKHKRLPPSFLRRNIWPTIPVAVWSIGTASNEAEHINFFIHSPCGPKLFIKETLSLRAAVMARPLTSADS